MGWRYSVSTAAVVIDNDRVLAVQRRDNDQWQIPGGVVEIGESLAKACAREVLEETGVAVAVGRVTGIYHHQTRDILALVFLATPLTANTPPQLSTESSQTEWLSLQQCSFRMSPIYLQRVRDAIEAAADGGPPRLREHDGRSWL